MTRPPPFATILDPDGTTAAWSRRAFLEVMGASLALGTAACERPKDRIVPWVRAPEDLVPGAATSYATARELRGLGFGLLVECHDGRPTKVEGNPHHPASRGATDLASQAAILSLYDPARASGVLERGHPTTLAAALAAVRGRPAGPLVVVLEPTSSALVHAALARLAASTPELRVVWRAPWLPGARWLGARLALGRPVDLVAPTQPPRTVLSFGADVLAAHAETLHLARPIMARRGRLVTFETAPSVTGAASDVRRALRPSALVAAVAGVLGAVARRPGPLAIPAELRAHLATLQGPDDALAATLAAELDGDALVLCDDALPPEAHVLAHALRVALGTRERTIAPVLGAAATAPSADLAGAAAVIVLADDPVHADPGLAEELARAPVSLYLGAGDDATARACRFHVAAAHPFETWDDLRAFDGSRTLVQPLVRPLRAALGRYELLAQLAGEPAPDAHAALRAGTPGLDALLARGLDPETAPAVPVTLDAAAVAAAAARVRPATDGIEVATVLDARLDGGRDRRNAWLAELPEPISKQTWGNALWLSPGTARRLGVATGDVVRVARGGVVEAPVIVVPGHADDAATIALGYGGIGVAGVDAWPLGRTTTAATLVPTGRREELAITMPPRPAGDRAILGPAPAATGGRRSLYVQEPRSGRQWAMSIDLERCTGCSVCVLACQAENNVPVVGAEGVRAGRIMHWLRIDRYVSDPEAAEPAIAMMPMLCQHCESAPCEYVCPVGATTHSTDGLNQMTYPRCVGTRFCSNNCPYKVRRFNWFDYNRDVPALAALAKNPDVTVRSRGVMEKCTYCVQRIREGERRARIADRPLAPDAVVTACQQACPTDAIAFGSLDEPNGRVVRERADPRSYSALGELGTRPRTTYLARKGRSS